MSKKIAVVLVAVCVLLSAACSRGPTEPSGPPITEPPVFTSADGAAIPTGARFNQGDEVKLFFQLGPGTGSAVVALVLSRDGDSGGTMTVFCHGSQAGRGGGTILKFQGKAYLWAKDHTLNGVMLETSFADPNEAFRSDGCYFFDGLVIPTGSSPSFESVRFDKAQKLTDIHLDWKVD